MKISTKGRYALRLMLDLGAYSLLKLVRRSKGVLPINSIKLFAIFFILNSSFHLYFVDTTGLLTIFNIACWIYFSAQ